MTKKKTPDCGRGLWNTNRESGKAIIPQATNGDKFQTAYSYAVAVVEALAQRAHISEA